MSIYEISSFASAFAMVCVAALSVLSRPLSKIEKHFFFFALAAACWQILNTVLISSYITGGGIIIVKISVLGLIAVPLFFMNFTLSLTGRRKNRLVILRISLMTAIVFAFAVLTPYLVKNVDNFSPVPGIFFPAFVLYFLGIFTASLNYLYLFCKSLNGTGKKESEYLLAASAVFAAGLFLIFLSWYGIRSGTCGNALITAGVAALYAVRKYSADEIRLTFMRAGLFTVVYAVILGVPFWLGIRTSRWMLSLALMGALASVGPFIYSMLGKKVKDILLVQQRRYQRILLQFSQSLSKEHDLEHLSRFIVYTLRRAVNIEFAALFLNDQENKAYSRKASRNAGNIHPKFHFSYKHPLITYLREHKKPLSIESLPESLEGFKEIDLGVRLIVPSFSEDKLIGFLFLGDKLDGTPYSSDDINVFETLSNQAALAIENCIYLREFEKAQEKIFNAEKLASIGGMADGVAHQIKNRLNHFSIASGEQQYEIEDFKKKYPKLIDSNPELKDTFDYLTGISVSMLENVKKTTNVIQAVLGFAREEEKGAIYGEFQIEEIIRPTVALLCVKHQINAFPLEIARESAQTINGIKSQLMECFYNIFDNAYEAIKEKMDYNLKEKVGFSPDITLKITKNDKSKIIEIADNGVGIKEENLKKIFAPFFTTKSSYKTGTGVGMYVVKRMIEQHNNGRIWVESEYLKGTKVFVELPIQREAVLS